MGEILAPMEWKKTQQTNNTDFSGAGISHKDLLKLKNKHPNAHNFISPLLFSFPEMEIFSITVFVCHIKPLQKLTRNNHSDRDCHNTFRSVKTLCFGLSKLVGFCMWNNFLSDGLSDTVLFVILCESRSRMVLYCSLQFLSFHVFSIHKLDEQLPSCSFKIYFRTRLEMLTLWDSLEIILYPSQAFFL